MLSAGSCAGASDLFKPRDLPAAVSGLLAPTAQPFAVVMSDVEAGPLAGTASPGGFTPTQIRHAYGFDQVFFNGGTITGDGAGQTIAIVNAYHASTAAFDLAAFDSAFGLPAPPSFTQVSQTGSTTVFPPTNSGWALETALDVQWAHALAPGASILLVEANSPGFDDLTTAVEYARAQPGVSVVSMSWGATDFAGETIYDSSFLTPTNHAGVVFAAAAGNSGSPGAYPAFSPNTLAVGGTSLALNGSNNISSETAWSGGGGGISQYEPQPSFQTDSGLVTQSSTQRTSPDVAFDANPNTGVPVYDSFNNGTSTPWSKVGGTSFATPSWAALVAIADQGRNLAGLPVLDGLDLMSQLYSMPASYFNDITNGTTGGATPQTAAIGYDLATGRGSPKVNLIVPALVGTASIGGTVFHDTNNNGTLDGEAGLAGWTVYSDLNNNSALDPIVVNTVNSTDVSKAIPNNTTITSNNIVSGLTGNIIDVNVKVNITHNNDSNLVLTLISPDNTRITLASHVGGSGNHFTNTVFDDSAAVAIFRGTSPFAGSYHPADPLSVVYGTNPIGTWKLEISDTTPTTSGTLNSWSLQFTTGDPSTTSAANGTYTLANLHPGLHRIREVLQSSYFQTSPAGGFYSINAAAGANVTAQNFGNWIPPSTSPSGVSLLAASDTGISNSDRITKLNNSSPASALEFQVAGTIAGATVTVFADGNAIGSATASGTTTTFTTNGSSLLGDGSRSITARQTEPGKPISASSPSLAITIDTVSPVSSIVPVSPNPHAGPVAQMTINFDEPVSGLDLSDLELTRDGGTNLLTGAQTVSTNDGLEWTLADLTVLTATAGFYQLSLIPTGSPIIDVAGNVDTASATTTFNVTANQPPIVDLDGSLSGGTGYASTWNNGGGAVNITAPANATVTDADNANLASMTATIATAHTGDVLSAVTTGTSITATWNGTNMLTLSGTDSVANYQAVLRTVKYNNTAGGPGVSSVTVGFVANDGTDNSATATATTTINSPPIVDLDGSLSGGTGFTSTWTNAGAVVITDAAAATVFEGDASNVTSMTATIVGVHAGDVLSATASGGVTVSYDSPNHVLNLTGTDTAANYQTVLRTVKYNNTSGGPGVDPVTVNFVGIDADGSSATAVASIDIDVSIVNSTLVGRYLFYNQSGTAGPTVRYDGNDPAINSLDDNAIASDKAAYLPGTGTATFANISSYSKGINGIMIDIAGPHGTITADDFIFMVGNNNAPSSWAAAPDPISVSVRAGAGTSGTDRVEIIWNNGDIKKQWLEVITLANANTGLEQQAGYPTGQADVFFFGNALANSGFGDTATLSTVDTTDELQARNNPAALFTNVPITNVRDYNRDAIVDTTDQLLARNNTTNPLTVTRYLSIGSPPAAPQGAPMTEPSGGSTAAPAATPAAAPMASSSGNPLTSRVAVSTSTDVNLVDRSLSQLTFSLAAASSERPQRGQASMPLEWLSFLDEQLLEILAVGRMRFASRRR